MAKLTDTQLIILSAAAARDDGLAIVPANMNRAAAAKAGSSLVARKLMREARAKRGMPVWREDGQGRPISLVITPSGRDAIGVDREQDEKRGAVAGVAAPANGARRRASRIGVETAVTPSNSDQPRAGSKQALIVGMLSAKTGATLGALVGATGWLPHTTRAALSGLRKRGFAIERSREGDATIYRIVAKTVATAA